ncbi:MAG: ABC transporter permease [Phycisphaerales bacterium]|nr:ABC transporter permease [Phycisphaerales bacterium]
MKFKINTQIAFHYLVSKKKQTFVASLGITFGISVFIFMMSLIHGTNKYFDEIIFQNSPHIKMYKDNTLGNSQLLNRYLRTNDINIITNPQFVFADKKIYAPTQIVDYLKKQDYTSSVTAQVSWATTYRKGNVEKTGNMIGCNIIEQDRMFDIAATMVAGNIVELAKDKNAIIIGYGLAKDLNLNIGDYVSVKVKTNYTPLRVVGIYKTTILSFDKTRTYINTAKMQNFLGENSDYITEILASLKDPFIARQVGKQLKQVFPYNVEDWQSANEQNQAGVKIRNMILLSVTTTILLVAGFGIYNILNMAIVERLKEIAILKATGFTGKDVISIFVKQSIFIGFIGASIGLILGFIVSFWVAHIYLGIGGLKYMPMDFSIMQYIEGFLFGTLTAFLAGYMPAIKASKVDPIQIIRG